MSFATPGSLEGQWVGPTTVDILPPGGPSFEGFIFGSRMSRPTQFWERVMGRKNGDDEQIEQQQQEQQQQDDDDEFYDQMMQEIEQLQYEEEFGTDEPEK